MIRLTAIVVVGPRSWLTVRVRSATIRADGNFWIPALAYFVLSSAIFASNGRTVDGLSPFMRARITADRESGR